MKLRYLIALAIFLLGAATVGAETEPCEFGFETGDPLPEARSRASAVTLGDFVYLVGGLDSGNDPQTNLWAYDPIHARWVAKKESPLPLGPVCAGALDGYLYALGAGNDGEFSADFLRYDPDANEWSPMADYPYGVTGGACGVIGDIFYYAGGERDSGETAAFHGYDREADEWIALPSMPAAKAYGTGVVFDGKFYVLGGWDADTMYRYDPDTEQWEILSTLPGIAHDGVAVASYRDYDILLFGLTENWIGTDDIYAYDSGLDVWSQAGFPTMTGNLTGTAEANFNDAVFVFAGNHGISGETTVIFNACAPYPGPVSPESGVNYQATAITITGLHFDEEQGSKIYLENRDGRSFDLNDLVIHESTLAKATVPSGLNPDVYDLVVTNAHADAFGARRREGAFVIEAPQPEIQGILPAQSEAGKIIEATIFGDHFFDPAEVSLQLGTSSIVIGAEVDAENSATITCTFDLTDVQVGTYDLVVKTENGSRTANEVLTVRPPSSGDDDDHPDDDGDTSRKSIGNVDREEVNLCGDFWGGVAFGCDCSCDNSDDDDDDDNNPDDDTDDDDHDDDDSDDDDTDDEEDDSGCCGCSD